jgi:hypothetical protein
MPYNTYRYMWYALFVRTQPMVLCVYKIANDSAVI